MDEYEVIVLTILVIISILIAYAMFDDMMDSSQKIAFIIMIIFMTASSNYITWHYRGVVEYNHIYDEVMIQDTKGYKKWLIEK